MGDAQYAAQKVALEYPTQCGTCAVSATCAEEWDVDAGGSTCGDRIKWLIDFEGKNISIAEQTVASEYPEQCGTCAFSTVCLKVWNTDAEGHTCGERIQWLLEFKGKDAQMAEQMVGLEYPEQCGTCSITRACVLVWNNDAQGYTCGDRIVWVLKAGSKTSQEAAEIVAAEYPQQCGGCSSGISLYSHSTDSSAPRVKTLPYALVASRQEDCDGKFPIHLYNSWPLGASLNDASSAWAWALDVNAAPKRQNVAQFTGAASCKRGPSGGVADVTGTLNPTSSPRPVAIFPVGGSPANPGELALYSEEALSRLMYKSVSASSPSFINLAWAAQEMEAPDYAHLCGYCFYDEAGSCPSMPPHEVMV